MRPALVLLAACGAAPVAPKPATPPAAVRHAGSDPAPVDLLAALAPGGDLSWVAPGVARLELGGAAIESPEGAQPLGVAILETQGAQLHVAIRLEHARFAVWTDRAGLLAVAASDMHVSDFAGGGSTAVFSGDPIEAVIREGAHVQRLAHRDRSTQIRYLGAVEINGWVSDAMLADRGPDRDARGRSPTGHPTLMVIPGAIIRTEPKWASRELAVVATGYFVDNIREIDDAWVEVGYADGDVAVHGYLSRHEPPGRVHRPKESEVPLAVITPNAAVASGTCLYARATGEPIGYVVGDRAVELAETGQPGWFALSIDTPWGALAFAAHGTTRTELDACAPPGSVPAPAARP